MIERWCGIRGWSVALSASALVACAPHSYELGKDEAGASGGGSGVSGSGAATSGASGGAGNGGGAGPSGTANAQGGDTVIGTGGSSIAGTDTGGADAAGGSVASGGSSTGGSIDLGAPLLEQLGTAPTKLDLLFMVDNSIGMADKQAQLALAIPAFLARFWSCVDDDGNRVGSFAPDSCAPGTRAEFGGLSDIHVGIITSSLGDHGSGDICSEAQNADNVAKGYPPSTYNDKAQLLPTVRDGLEGADDGFLFWDPNDADEHHSHQQVFAGDVQSELTAAGEHGCGYEAQLESWYRFLVDPEPVNSIGHSPDTAVNVRSAANDVVLKQRAAFLRPDSVLAIVMLTDENDCSVADEDGMQGWLVGYKGGVSAQTLWHMPRASTGCESSPNDPKVCYPCSQGQPLPGCSGDAILPANEDSLNMRCYHQAQRFGVDLLYPVERYVSAITRPTLRPRLDGPELPNPLFAAGPNGAPGRAAGQVVLAGIVGVPWQDVATQESWGGAGLELLSAEKLQNEGRWDVIVGDPAAGVDPIDPLMIESIDPREAGFPHPFVDAAHITAEHETHNSNPINGREQSALAIRDDLQFACIYPLAVPVPCSDANADSCDCNYDDFARNSPLCEGTTATEDGTQVYGKAYPSVRELQVLKGVGSSAVVASVCPKSPASGNADDADAGYVPALDALADRLVRSFADSCLLRSLSITQCAVIEARPSDGANCDIAGRIPPDSYGADIAQRVEDQMRSQGYIRQEFTLCQIQALEGDELDACENTAGGGSGAGYCYLDADRGLGDPSLLASCPASMKHRIRFVGEDLPASGALTFLSCFQLR